MDRHGTAASAGGRSIPVCCVLRPLFVAESGDGVEPARPIGGITAASGAHPGRDGEGDADAPRLDDRRHDGAGYLTVVDTDRDTDADCDAEEPSADAKSERFRHELEDDVSPAGAHSTADAYLAGPLGHAHEHDVH